MIIVKTKNGDHFINEKSTTEVWHDREKGTIMYYAHNGMTNKIENVEGVLYTYDAQPTSWKVEGSEIQRLLKICNERREIVDKQTKQLNAIKDDFLHFAHDMAEIVNKYNDQIPDEIKKQIRPRADELKSKLLNRGYAPD